MGKILFLVPYPSDSAPSQRYRFEQYLEILEFHGYQWQLVPFFDRPTWQILYKDGHYLKKAIGLVKGLLVRLLFLFKVREYDWVFIHRESLPAFPPWYEWLLCRVLGKKIVFDFDDAIWIPQTSKSNEIISAIRHSNKTSIICRLSNKVSVGNAYLAQYAKQFNRNVHLIPTTIDTMHLHNRMKIHQQKEVVVGWTGSHSTMPYLELVLPALRKLEQQKKFKFLVISNKPPDFFMPCLQYKEWNIHTEIEDLMAIDIGLMPLPQSEWALGKCGLKALQYMALGIPALVSPVGVNQQIVMDSLNGFHCHHQNDWFLYIDKLLDDHELRNKLGSNGRERVEQQYSVKANYLKFLKLFQK